MDAELLRKIDAGPGTIGNGGSAFAKRRHEMDRQIARAYDGQTDARPDEISELVDGQEWPGN